MDATAGAHADAAVLSGGVGLFFERTAAPAARVLFWYLAAWVLLLKIPPVVVAPLNAGKWNGLAEIVVLFTGAWVSHAAHGKSVRLAQRCFALSLPLIGLAHFVYTTQTAALVPAWLPHRTAWAWLTGAGHFAAGAGVLFSICPRLAATMEAGMLAAFGVLVWVPAVVAEPAKRLPWTALLITWAIAATAWVVAGSLAWRSHRRDPLANDLPKLRLVLGEMRGVAESRGAPVVGEPGE